MILRSRGAKAPLLSVDLMPARVALNLRESGAVFPCKWCSVAEIYTPSDDERPEQKPTPETTATTVEASVEPINTETTAEPLKAPAETIKEENPTEIPENVETPSENVTEPPKAEFDVNYWISFARSYALQIGLEIDETAVDCWDNPTTANADCIYLERDLTHRLDRYNRDDDITAVNIWAESLENENYLIYIAYA